MCANAGSQVLFKMARVIVTFKIMPSDPSVDLDKVSKEAEKIISDFEGTIMDNSKQPIGFGLVAIHLKFNMDEKKGSTEPIEDMIKQVEGVESVEVIAISRAFG